MTDFLAPLLPSGKLVMRSPVRRVRAQEATAEGSLPVPLLVGPRTQLLSAVLSTAHGSTHVNSINTEVEGDFARDVKPSGALGSRSCSVKFQLP